MNFSEPSLTLAYINCQIIYTNLYFGRPFQLLFIEDLAIKYNSEQLREFFENSVRDFMESTKLEDSPVFLDEQIFKQKFHSYVQQRYDKTLYEKYTYFMLSVFEDTHKKRNKTLIQVERGLLGLIGS